MSIRDEIHTHWIDKLAIANGFVSGVALWPQVLQTLFTGVTAGLSVWALGLILVNSLVWILYSLHRGLVSLALASILNAISAGTLLLLIFLV